MGPCFPKQRSQDGFSLVELMIVIAIMLLLAALAMPRLLDAQKSAYQAGVVSLLRTLQSDQESYRLANGSYSDNFTDLGLATLGPGPLRDFFEPQVASPTLAERLHVGARPAPLLAVIFPAFDLFSLTAGLQEQQTPQPKKKFGTQKKPGDTQIGPAAAPTSPTVPGSGSGASKRPPLGRGGRSAPGAPPAGGGTPSGGGTGGTGAAPTGAPQGGGPSIPFSPSPASAAKTKIVIKHNYIFTLGRPTPTTWWCTAAPVRDRGNSKFFFMDQTGVIRSEWAMPASATSPQM